MDQFIPSGLVVPHGSSSPTPPSGTSSAPFVAVNTPLVHQPITTKHLLEVQALSWVLATHHISLVANYFKVLFSLQPLHILSTDKKQMLHAWLGIFSIVHRVGTKSSPVTSLVLGLASDMDDELTILIQKLRAIEFLIPPKLVICCVLVDTLAIHTLL